MIAARTARKNLPLPRYRGIASGPVHLAQAEPHGPGNLNNQNFPEEEKS
jgi:hypothetical protein